MIRTLLLCVALHVGGAVDAPSLPMAVPANDPHVRLSGRWDHSDAAVPRCAWTACAIQLRFTGSACNVLLAGKPELSFQIVVDGKPTTTLQLVDGQSLYTVASALPKSEHTIELWKSHEAMYGVIDFKGLQLAAGSKLLDLPKIQRRIEFIGDSITAGYGNEAAGHEQHFTLATQNGCLTWGVFAARALKADLMCEAWSGIRMTDDGKDKDHPTMPQRWERILPTWGPVPNDAQGQWDFSSWQADAVVINLGTNDMGTPVEEKTWADAYRSFIASIRKHYPKAHVFLTIGPMGHGPDDCIAHYNTTLAEALAKEGDKRIHALALPNQNQADGIGADWHPSVKTHQLMADTIVAAIKHELGW